jgi:hypothetical protein
VSPLRLGAGGMVNEIKLVPVTLLVARTINCSYFGRSDGLVLSRKAESVQHSLWGDCA